MNNTSSSSNNKILLFLISVISPNHAILLPLFNTVLFICSLISWKYFFKDNQWYIKPNSTIYLVSLKTSILFIFAHIHACMLSRFSHVLGVTPGAAANQAPLSMGLSRQEYWSGLPCPHSWDLLDPGDWTRLSCISCIVRWDLYYQHHLGSPYTYTHKYINMYICIFTY